MSERLEYKTSWPFYKIGLFYAPMICIFLFMFLDEDESFLIYALIFTLLALISLDYREFKLYSDRLTISKKNIIIPLTRTEFDLPLNRLKDIKFEKGAFDRRIFIAGIIASLLNLGRFSKSDIDHEVIITYYDEFTNETFTKVFSFDHRHSELEEIIKITVSKRNPAL